MLPHGIHSTILRRKIRLHRMDQTVAANAKQTSQTDIDDVNIARIVGSQRIRLSEECLGSGATFAVKPAERKESGSGKGSNGAVRRDFSNGRVSDV